MRNAIARLLRWLSQAVTSPVAPRALRCPHCGEDRLVERKRDGGGYCAVCGRTWIEDTDGRARGGGCPASWGGGR